MIKWLIYFFQAWRGFPAFKSFCEAQGVAEQMKKDYKGRFDYAKKNAKTHYAHRDKYGRKCRKHGGDCEKCNAKHC